MTDPNALGLSITSVLGSLGAAGAAVAVTFYFLAFLRDQSEKTSRFLHDFRDYHAESQKKFQDQIDRLVDRLETSQCRSQSLISKITESQIDTIKRSIDIMTITRDILHPEIQAAIEKCRGWQLSDEELEELMK